MYSRDFAKDLMLNSVFSSCDIDEEPSRTTSYSEFYTKHSIRREEKKSMEITNVIFNGPATIVFWADGTKTVVKCQEGDAFDPNTGLAHAISKKALGDSYKKEFKKWTEKYNVTRPLVLTDEALEKLRANLLARLKGE